MTVTQEDIIKRIAEKEDISIATVRDVLKSAEKIIFDYLSSTTPTEKIIIKPLNGFSIERKYIDEKIYNKGMFRNLNCPEHINTKTVVSKYYNNRVNKRLFDREDDEE